ncbi:MAG: SHOCT domain-containing protein [Kiritimatiellaeota bacterium]|nr:SHOCT domain-containing protein [Kiritimatiellota bacterium]
MNEQDSKNRNVSEKRKNLYAFGIGLTVLGAVMIVVGFAGFVLSGIFGDGRGRGFRPDIIAFFLTFGGGMGVSVLAHVIREIAARGVAGSGLVLDPEKARKDLEPWSRMGGGMIRDVLDESGIAPKPTNSQQLPLDEKLRRLNSLKDDGLISEAEFEAARKKIMSSLL